MCARKKKEKIDLDNKEFQDAWKLLRFTNRSIFMTGRAGSGKSTFLRYITDNIKKKHVILAPTGIAAVNVGGQTLHSFFKLPLKPVLADDPDFAISRLRERMKYTRRFIKLLQQLELIIIDEISMVRADTIDFIDKLLRVFCCNMRQPFAGKQLLLVGDIFQLEPVVSSDMRSILRHHYPQPFFFYAKIFSDIALIPIELQRVYRQKETQFVEILDRVRQGKPTPLDMMAINSRVGASVADSDDIKSPVMTLATRRDIVDHINQTRLDAIRKPSFTFKGRIEGDFPETSLPTSLELTLKEGAQVLFIKNDRERRWVNGTLGQISKIAADLLEVKLTDGNTYIVEPETWANIRYDYDEKKHKVIEKELGSFTQYPLKAAWALTIHKSQGLTFDNIIVDIGQGTFASGQSYVALSRCTSLEGISLVSPVSPRDMVVNPSIVGFSHTFNDQQSIDNALSSARADDLYTQAIIDLDNGSIVSALDKWNEANALKRFNDGTSVIRLTRRKLMKLEHRLDRIGELEQHIATLNSKLAELAQEYIEMGRDCADNGLLDAAMANYRKASDLNPASAETHIEIARLFESNNENTNAIIHLKRAAQLDQENTTIPCMLAANYLAVDDIYNSLDTLLEAIGRFPDEIGIHQSLAKTYRKAGDDDEAARHEAIARALAKGAGSIH